mmetsp:Transcript_20304/g.61186  ORF Transcript_20304/g.61186 Transcript_20304/m.61186 type:complete len:146 (-) Transcript_20304:180-617(-)
MAAADPFGLQHVLQAQHMEATANQEASATWTYEECLNVRRWALLDCFDGMKAACSHAWAHLSTEIAIEELMKNRAGFTASQQPRLSELQQFAKQQRLQRQRGPSARDQRRDTTTFEAARKTWGAATVSARGSIMTGNHKAETWLG